MAFSFSSGENRQKYLIGVFILLLVVVLFIFRDNFLSSGNSETSASPTFFKKTINIDFKTLDSLKNLQSYEEIKPFGGKIGQDNPFYQQ